MKGRIKGQNFYKTSLSSAIPSGSSTDTTEKSFTVAESPIGTKGWLVVDFTNNKKEIIFYHNVVGNSIYYYDYNRQYPSYQHDVGAIVQMNDVAEFINYLGNNIDDFGQVVEKTGLDITVYGGNIRLNNQDITISDTDITLTDDTTNYIVLDYTDNTIKSLTDISGLTGILLAEIVTSGGSISSITDKRQEKMPFILDGVTLTVVDGKVEIKDLSVGTDKITDGAVTESKIAASAVTTDKIADTSITEAKIVDSAVTTDKIADSNITESKLADGSVTNSKLGDSSVSTEKIQDSAITTAKIADGNVTVDKLSTDSVSTDKIIDLAVTTDKIADINITNAKLQDGAVTTTKLTDSAVTNVKIADGAIDVNKLATDIDGSSIGFNADKVDGLDASDFVRSTGTVTQTIDGDKTFTGAITMTGDLTVEGTLTTIDTENLVVSDKLITVNKGGIDADGSGIEVEENGSIVASITYNKNTDRWNDGIGDLQRVGEVPDHTHPWYEIDKTGSKLTDIADVDDNPNIYQALMRDGTKRVTSGEISADHFYDLLDTPSDYTGYAGQVVKINSTEDGLEFGTIGNAILDDGAVSTSKIQDEAVTVDKIDSAYDSTLVHTTGDETIGGIKTFTDRININTTAVFQVWTETDTAVDAGGLRRFVNDGGSFRIDRNTSTAGDFSTYEKDLVIDSSGNIGINTTAPTEKLEVNGNIKTWGRLIGNDNSLDIRSTDQIAYGSWANGAFMWLASMNNTDSTDTKGSIRLHLMQDDTVGNNPFFDIYRLKPDGTATRFFKLDINSGYYNGSFGIGTTSPGGKLEVDANNTGVDAIVLKNSGATHGPTLMLDATGNYSQDPAIISKDINGIKQAGIQFNHINHQIIIYDAYDGANSIYNPVIYMNRDSGLIQTKSDFECLTAGAGLILADSNGVRYKLTINTNGELEINTI